MVKQSGLHCSVITPEQQLVDADVDSVVLPAHDGLIGILHNRAPLLCEVGIGVLRLSGGQAGSDAIYVDGGFAQVLDNEVTVLTPRAIPVGSVDKKLAEKAEAEAAQIKVTDDASLQSHDKAMTRARTLRELAR